MNTPKITEDNHYARGIVIQSVEPNKLKVGGAEVIKFSIAKDDSSP